MGNNTSPKISVKKIEKPWGYEELLFEGDGFGFKRLVFYPEKTSSYHYHKEKNEIFYIEKGSVNLRFENSEKNLKQGEFVYLKKGTKHQIKNTGTENLEILEFGYPYSTKDVIRVEDPWKGIRKE